MRKLFSFAAILFLAVICGACVNTFAVHELNQIAAKYIEEGNYNAAISRLESSIDLDGAVYESRYNLAVAYLKVDECEKALKQIEEASKLTDKEPVVFYTMGVANNCIADGIYHKKGADGVVEEIKYDEINSYTMAKKYIDYLAASNSAFDKYLSLVPTASDAEDVKGIVMQNEQKIAETKQKYNLE